MAVGAVQTYAIDSFPPDNGVMYFRGKFAFYTAELLTLYII